jgi:hypothetical protein
MTPKRSDTFRQLQITAVRHRQLAAVRELNQDNRR